MTAARVDVCIIGAGSGGLSVAAGAAQMGARVVLIEAGEMGGDCLNRGCVPSKALIAAAARAHAMQGGREFGIAPAEPGVDFAAVKDHVRQVIETIAPHDSQARFEGLGVRVIRARGRFVSPREVEAGGERIRARRFVIATGSAPLVPPIPGLDRVPFETNETIFQSRERPDHLLVIGGGPIGMEMAQAHARLGARVTVIEGLKALGRDDPENAAVVLDAVRGEGVEIVEDAMAREVRGRAGAIEVEVADGRVFAGTHLLVAVGRKANVADLGLDAAGIAHDRAIKVDARLRTTNRRVFAIGDVTGRAQFTHAAGYDASVVLRNLMFGLPARARADHMPWATYTEPELAQVGLGEAEARARYGDRVEAVSFPFAENDRAVATRQTAGRVKVWVVRGRPVGASIVGPNAGEQIALWSMMIANRMKLSALAMTVLPYPTLSEASKRAAGAYFAPRLFDSALVKGVVRMVQRLVP